MDIDKLKDKFKELYGTSFDRAKLEDALIEHFGTFSIQKINAWRDINGELNPAVYIASVNYGWDKTEISTNGSYSTAEQALIGLFIEAFDEPILDINNISESSYEYHTHENHLQKFKEIVKAVYNVEK